MLRKAGFDKKSAFITTFGSIFVGLIGATYGTNNVNSFKTYIEYYIENPIKMDMSIRFGILAITYVAFNFFNVLNLKKSLKSKKNDETKEDPFAVEEPKQKNVKGWPIITLLAIVFIFAIIGYAGWDKNFGIKIFSDIHKKLVELKIGDYTIISYILGNLPVLGEWDIFTISALMGVITIVAAIIYRVSFDDFIDGIISGMTKMFKPVAIMVFSYVVFGLVYLTPIIPTILNNILTTEFKVFQVALSGITSSFFVQDIGFISYQMSQFFITAYATKLDTLVLIYGVTSGFVQIFAPTSGLLLLGLSYSKVSYKDWIKYILKFLLVMIVIISIILATL